jgi:sugar lactone lactonase YvrE
MSRPQPRHLGRLLATTLGLPALLLGSLTASAFTGAGAGAAAAAPTASTATATGPHLVKHAIEDDMCDPIRFGTHPANAAADAAAKAKAAKSVRFPARIELPAGFQPEGIAIDRSGTAYFGSRADGDIYAANLRTGVGKVITQGPGTASLGMKTDQRGRLFVAGGGGGNGRVIDTRSGAVLASYTFTTATTFVNDVILSKDAAWFTDSRQPVLYKVPLGRNGKLPAQAAVQTVPLTGDYVHVEGVNNANGIELTPDGRNLIIVQSSTGFLFRVDPSTGVTRKIDLGTAVMTNGDGLLLRKDTLYVVQNRLNKIAVLDLNKSGSQGRLVREIASTDFDVPTTAAFYGSRIYLPNARFTTPPTPETAYWATAVKR